MKIIYITNGGSNQGEGIALLNILKGLDRTKFHPVVVISHYSDYIKELNSLNIPYYIIPSFNNIYPTCRTLKDKIYWLPRLLRIKLYNLLAEFKFENIVKTELPDVIHTNTGVIRYGNKIAKRYSILHVWHIREYQTKDFSWKPLGGINKLKSLYSHPNNHCISISNDIFNYFNLSRVKDTIIYDGVFSETSVHYESEKEDYFLFVGCLKKEKGVLDVIKSFEDAVERLPKNVELWLVGKDELNINKIIGQSLCSKRIKYIGVRNDVYQLMSKAKALLVPSLFEGFGFITAEAMLNKCIVIGRNTGGTKEQFDNGVNFCGREIGLRFNNTLELSQLMCSVVSNGTEFYSQLKNDAYNTVINYYTIEKNVNQLDNLYIRLKK